MVTMFKKDWCSFTKYVLLLEKEACHLKLADIYLQVIKISLQ